MKIQINTAVAIPVNAVPLTDDTDFKSREVAIAYNESGMDLVWNFVTAAGVQTQTAVTPTTGGDYDWTHVGDGMYRIEIPASGGASINNDTAGYGWFSGVCDGVLPWVSPIYEFCTLVSLDALDTAQDAQHGTTRSELAKVPKSDGTSTWNATALASINAEADQALADAGVTSTRMGYLVGQVATQADVQAITQAQRVRISLPQQLERPDSGSTTYRVWIYVYDEQHKAEDLDSLPTVAVENNAGTDRSANIGTVTKPGTTTGIYYVDYTVADDHAIEGLTFKVDCTEGGVTTQYPASTIVVDTTAVDFSASDRANLDAALAVLQHVTYGNAAIQTGVAAIPTNPMLDTEDGSSFTGQIVTAMQAAGTYLKVLYDDWIDDGRLDNLLDSAAAGGGLDAAGVRAAIGMEAADLDDQLDTISGQIDGIEAGSGSGANTIQFEITDTDTLALLENATVSLRLNSLLKASGLTLATGRLTGNGLAVSATGTYELAVTCSGYNGYTADYVVTAGENALQEIALTAIATTPSTDPTKSTVTIVCHGSTTNVGDGTVVESGVTIQVQQTSAPSGSTNRAFDGSIYNYTSNASGIVSLTLWRNAEYRWRRDGGRWETFIPDESSYNVGSIVGEDQ